MKGKILFPKFNDVYNPQLPTDICTFIGTLDKPQIIALSNSPIWKDFRKRGDSKTILLNGKCVTLLLTSNVNSCKDGTHRKSRTYFFADYRRGDALYTDAVKKHFKPNAKSRACSACLTLLKRIFKNGYLKRITSIRA